MRISDWSSDVCSSDLSAGRPDNGRRGPQVGRANPRRRPAEGSTGAARLDLCYAERGLIVLSGLFIEMPRLAFVVSIVLSLPGILAIFALPVEQFPDIVPPPSQASATYAGANAESGECTAANPQ